MLSITGGSLKISPFWPKSLRLEWPGNGVLTGIISVKYKCDEPRKLTFYPQRGTKKSRSRLRLLICMLVIQCLLDAIWEMAHRKRFQRQLKGWPKPQSSFFQDGCVTSRLQIQSSRVAKLSAVSPTDTNWLGHDCSLATSCWAPTVQVNTFDTLTVNFIVLITYYKALNI